MQLMPEYFSLPIANMDDVRFPGCSHEMPEFIVVNFLFQCEFKII